MNVRNRLAELIVAGLRGRPLNVFYDQAVAHFRKHGETLPFDTLTSWMAGERYPRTQLRQDLLGDVVGGQWGEEIKCLPEPAFRHYTGYQQRGDMRTTKKPQEFQTIRHLVGDKMVTYKRISCGKCEAVYDHPFRAQLRIHDDFKKKNWLVGALASQNRCPQCQEKKKMPRFDQHNGKVIEMTSRLEAQPPPSEPAREMTRTDKGVIIVEIAGKWDELNSRYLAGSSDLKVANSLGVPYEWVRQVREAEFGGSGEDPGDLQLIEEVLKLKSEISGLILNEKSLHDGDIRIAKEIDAARDAAKNATKLADNAHSEAEHQRLERERHTDRLNAFRKKLEAVESKLPFPKAKAS